MVVAESSLSADTAFSIGLLAGWLALVIALTWQDVHCSCCIKKGGKK